VGFGGLVVGFEYGGDGEAVLDPHDGRGILYERSRIQQVLTRRLGIAERERRPPGAEERFSSGSGRGLRQASGPEKLPACRLQVEVVQRDVAQSQEGFRRIVKSLCKREVESASNRRLSRRKRGGSDRQMVSKQLSGAGPVGRLRDAGAGGDENKRGKRSGCGNSSHGREAQSRIRESGGQLSTMSRSDVQSLRLPCPRWTGDRNVRRNRHAETNSRRTVMSRH